MTVMVFVMSLTIEVLVWEVRTSWKSSSLQPSNGRAGTPSRVALPQPPEQVAETELVMEKAARAIRRILLNMGADKRIRAEARSRRGRGEVRDWRYHD